MFRFALHGTSSQTDFQEAEQLLAEWNAFYESRMAAQKESKRVHPAGSPIGLNFKKTLAVSILLQILTYLTLNSSLSIDQPYEAF